VRGHEKASLVRDLLIIKFIMRLFKTIYKRFPTVLGTRRLQWWSY